MKKQAFVGAGFGLALLILSIAIGGGGHGFVVPLIFSAAPLPVGVFQSALFQPIGLFSSVAVPFLWAGLFILACSARRRTFPWAIGLHYAAAISYVALAWRDEFDDPYRNTALVLHFVAPYTGAFVAVTLLGQIWLWHNFVKVSPGPSLL